MYLPLKMWAVHKHRPQGCLSWAAGTSTDFLAVGLGSPCAAPLLECSVTATGKGQIKKVQGLQ